MTVPNSEYKVKYQGSGITNEVFYIPFGFGSLSDIKVQTVDSNGHPTNKTGGGTHYTATGATSDGTSTVISGVPADYGWITWNGTSPTDIVYIFREGEITVDLNLHPGNKNFEEKGLDRMTEAMSRYCKRSETDPQNFDGQGRAFVDLGQPRYAGDAARTTELTDYAAVTSFMDVPSYSSGNEDNLLTVRRGIPTNSVGEVQWTPNTEVPSLTGDNRKILTKESGGPEWQVQNWIPTAPDDGLGYFLSVDQAGTMSWAKVYETPSIASTAQHDVVSLSPIEQIDWRTLDEAPYSSAYAAKQKRFIIKNSESGTVTWGPRYTTGSLTVNPVANEMASGSSPNGGWHGIPYHTGTNNEWTVAHGMKADDGSTDVAPDRVFLMVETQKYKEKIHSDNFDIIPFFVVRLNPQDGANADVGITSTHLNGRHMFLNVNDGGLQSGVANPIARSSVGLGDGGARNGADTNNVYTMKIHFLAVKD